MPDDQRRSGEAGLIKNKPMFPWRWSDRVPDLRFPASTVRLSVQDLPSDQNKQLCLFLMQPVLCAPTVHHAKGAIVLLAQWHDIHLNFQDKQVFRGVSLTVRAGHRGQTNTQ